jgi:AcrR family transcriptional regulator
MSRDRWDRDDEYWTPDGPDPISDERQRILTSATELLLESGVAATTVWRVADHAGLSVAEVRALFRSRAALLVEAVGREAQSFFGSVVRSLNAGSPGSAVLTRLIVELQAGPPTPLHRLFAELIASAIRDPELRDEVEPHLHYADAAIVVVIRQAKADARIAADVDVEALSSVCMSLILGSCLRASIELVQPERGAAESVIMRFVDGLADRLVGELDLRDGLATPSHP